MGNAGKSGKYCEFLGNAGKSWEIVEIMGNHGKCWEIMGNAGKCWEIMGNAGKCWEMLGSIIYHIIQKWLAVSVPPPNQSSFQPLWDVLDERAITTNIAVFAGDISATRLGSGSTRKIVKYL